MILEAVDDEIPPPYVRFIKEAKKQSELSKSRFKLGATLTKKKRILGKGFNTRKTHPIYGSGRYDSLHAETHALYKAILAGHEVQGSTVYVYRANYNLAKPCEDCEKILREHGISKVVYTA